MSSAATIRWRFSWILLLAATSATTDSSTHTLPSALTPTHYDITLNLGTLGEDAIDSFNGSLVINFTVVEATHDIVLNSVNHTIDVADVIVTDSSGESVRVRSASSDKHREMATVTLQTPLTVGGSYSMAMTLRNVQFSHDLRGLFLAPRSTPSMEVLVATQFSPVYARRMIPCFDEPRFRAKFTLRVNTDANMTVLSNTALSSSSDTTSGVYVFDTTPSMPTYLLGLVIAKKMKNASSTEGFMTLFGRAEVVKRADKTLEIARAILSHLTEYTNVSHGLSQLKIVALKEHFFTAMENWGLITFRDPALIFDDDWSVESQIRALTVLGHELGHQWFGNLVTICNWSNAWLKEGFATFFGYTIGDKVDPTQKLHHRFYSKETRVAMRADSNPDAHALNNTRLGNTSSILQNMDRITYSKGASILNSIQHILGSKDIFRTGVQLYVRDNLYGCGSPAKLYSALERALKLKTANANVILPSNATLTDVLTTWVNQEGFPVVNVVRNYQTNLVYFTQERFRLASGVDNSTDTTGRWWVPISYVTGSNYRAGVIPAVTNWIEPGKATRVQLAAEPSEWLLVNDVHTDFYRVNYDTQNWLILAHFLKSAYMSSLRPATRAVLVEDAMELARESRMDYALCFQLLDYLRQETELEPWEAARAGFDFLDIHLRESAHDELYKRWQLALVTPVLVRLQLQSRGGIDPRTRLLRGLITDWACDLQVPTCVKSALQDFNRWLDRSQTSTVSRDSLSAAVCAGARLSAFRPAMERLLAEQDARDRRAIIRGLGCADIAHLTAFLSLPAERNALIRSEPAAIYGSVARFGGRKLSFALNVFKNKTAEILKNSGIGAVTSIYVALAESVSTTSDSSKLREVWEVIAGDMQANDTSSARAATLLSHANVAWRAERLDAVGEIIRILLSNDTTGATTPETNNVSAATTVTSACLIIFLGLVSSNARN